MDDDDFALLEQFVRMVLDETAALLNKSADQFVASLQEWLDDLLNHPIPEDWRAELARFVEHGIYYGMQMLPESLRTVEEIIAARVAGTGPFAAIGPAPRDAAAMAAGPRIVINADPLITMPAHWKPPEPAGGVQFLAVATINQPSQRQAAGVAQQPAAPSAPRGVFSGGLEVAGPGPETTQSYRDKVQKALEILDPLVARWWASIGQSGLVRAWKAAGLYSWWSASYAQIEGNRLVIYVDESFTAEQAAVAIRAEARGGKFSDSFNNYRVPHGFVPEFIALRKENIREAAGLAAVIAEVYVTTLASITPAGDWIVSLDDLTTNGFQWRQLLAAIPLMARLPKGVKSLRIRFGGKGAAAKEIVITGSDLAMFNRLDDAAVAKLVAKIEAAANEREAAAIIERELAALKGSSAAAPPAAITPSPEVLQVRIDPKTGRGPMAVDTRRFTSGPRTKNGGIRNSRQFWKDWEQRYGTTLSPDNKNKILAGDSPKVDDAWVRSFPEHAPYRGETIIHHHLDKGPLAIPLPQSLHEVQPGRRHWHFD